jgi:hypothetical protein
VLELTECITVLMYCFFEKKHELSDFVPTVRMPDFDFVVQGNIMNYMGISEHQYLLLLLFALDFNVNHATLCKYCK